MREQTPNASPMCRFLAYFFWANKKKQAAGGKRTCGQHALPFGAACSGGQGSGRPTDTNAPHPPLRRISCASSPQGETFCAALPRRCRTIDPVIARLAQQAVAIRSPAGTAFRIEAAKDTDCHVGLRPPRNDTSGSAAVSAGVQARILTFSRQRDNAGGVDSPRPSSAYAVMSRWMRWRPFPGPGR